MKITKIANGKSRIRANKTITMPPPPSTTKPSDIKPPKVKPSDVKPLIDQLDKSSMPGVKEIFKGPGKQPIANFMAELSNVAENPRDMSKVKSKLQNLDNKLDNKK